MNPLVPFLRHFSTFIAVVTLQAADSGSDAKQRPSPYLSPQESLAHFELPDGYRLELVLSEPEIREPVVTVFDGNGRMFVAEMRSYMQDIDGKDQRTPVSRVSMHWSSKADGNFDRHSVFIDGLVLPRMLLPLGDSLLVHETDSADIHEYRDTDGDGVADQKTLFYRGEPRRSNLEHQTSGLVWCADNWIYSTFNSYRLRWTPQGVVRESTGSNGGQWGLSQDNFGKPWFVNAGGELGPVNFQYPIVYGGFKALNEFGRGYTEVWPLVPIPDVQGGTKRFRPEEKTLNHFTATCGTDFFRGDRMPEDLRGDLLFCEPVGRLIRRTKVDVDDGITRLSNRYDRSEFVRSSDPYFRPVNLVTAPDGTLYITDMYRGIIQEGNWTRAGSYLRSVIQEYQLDGNVGRGRIWRLRHRDFELGRTPRMLDEKPTQWVQHLRHANGWWRDTAQKLLILRQDLSVVPALLALLRSDPNPLARFHALWTLEGLGALNAGVIEETLRDQHPQLRAAAIRAGETVIKQGDGSLARTLEMLIADPDPGVVTQVMLTAELLKWPDSKALVRKAVASHASKGIREIGAGLLNPSTSQIGSQFKGEQRVLLERGKGAYMELCFACHGLDGKGAVVVGRDGTLAPSLANSNTVTGHRDGAILALLHGVTGPIERQSYESAMMPMGANDDEWIAAVVSFIRTSFGNRATLVTPAEVARVRQESAERKEPWTIQELKSRVPQRLGDRQTWKVTASHGADSLPALTDANPTNAYSTRAPQAPGMWIQIELPAVQTVSGLRLGTTRSSKNFPRGYRVQSSLDGFNWSSSAAEGRGTGPLTDVVFAARPARFLRLTQTETAADSPWTIDDLEIYVSTSVLAQGSE